MMFLSRIQPAPGFIVSRLAERAHRGDAYAQHQFLWTLFRGKERRDFLFRLEMGKTGPVYYLLSETAPDSVPEDLKIDTKLFAPRLHEGEVLAYTLRANPTKTLKTGEPGQRGKKVDVLMHAKYMARGEVESALEMQAVQEQAAKDWLLDSKRQQRLGVGFMAEPEVTEYTQHQVRKTDCRDSPPIRFSSVNYEGLLRVQEPERFLAALGQGIGRSKAMGCGLMLIKRP